MCNRKVTLQNFLVFTCVIHLCAKVTLNSQGNQEQILNLNLSIHIGILMLVTQSCPTLCDLMDYSLPGSSVHGILQARVGWVTNHSFLQGIFPTQGSNPGLWYCRKILYCLSHLETSKFKFYFLECSEFFFYFLFFFSISIRCWLNPWMQNLKMQRAN